MEATKGNEWWRLRSSHGRNPKFETPEQLWEASLEYFEATDQRKWKKTEFHGKDAAKCIVDQTTPYTKTGLYIFLDIVEGTWFNYKEKKDFFGVTTRVEAIIYTQKLEGASVGAFNASIIARDLGLKDNSEITISKPAPIFGDDSL